MLALLLCQCYDAYLLLVLWASQIAMIASNLFTLPSKPLFGYVTALLSPSYSIASCRCSCRLFHVGTWISWIFLGYHNISYLINAHIYLVKGGRLGLMSGVLFHSCHPSFCHTGVMFLDFPSLTRWGVWDPLDVLLWIKLFQQGPTLVLTFAIIILEQNN